MGRSFSHSVHLGAKLCHVGSKLGRSWSQVGIWAEVGVLLAKVGPLWSPSCGNAGSKTTISTMKMAPPQLKLYLFISSAAKLPRLGTFSPGRFCGLLQPTHPNFEDLIRSARCVSASWNARTSLKPMRTISPASRQLDSCGMWRDVFFIWPLYNFDWAEGSNRSWGLLEGMRHEDEVPGLGGPLSTSEEVNPTRNLCSCVFFWAWYHMKHETKWLMIGMVYSRLFITSC